MTDNGPEVFRVTQGLCYYERAGVHCIEASDGQGRAFHIHLPAAIESGSFSLGLSERAPMIIHVTGHCEAELYRGRLELKVGGDAHFCGSFSGIDADGFDIENGIFRLEHPFS
ncbi:hypothetical protein PS918_01611 [Pseudomonas fluorescens]|uniref:Uncharacterized protein n=2 Tax=Pseudomonas fluorescens TaxID=294 RepID=A0A5E7RGN1_PSEFL|nr:hypothetical protein PS918_01611 [Pseudomonas fluorescens]